MDRPPTGSPRTLARIAGSFYLLTFVTGSLALGPAPIKSTANLLASVCYVVVTLLFYRLFRPVHRGLSLLAAIVGLAGCVLALLRALHLAAIPFNELGIFGIYCLLIGTLIWRSGFLPRFLGVLMALGGLGWLTFLAPSLARPLAPWNFAPGMIGEGFLTVWLLVAGVDAARWGERAAA